MVARIARSEVLYDGCYVHVISRSIRKTKLFIDNDDFEEFLKLLKYSKVELGFKLYHYCIMQTHFHLAVGIEGVGSFSKAMQFLKSQYSYKYHTKYKLSGPIWRDRYKSLLIEDAFYMRACGKYIENNPVKAGLVVQAKQWKHSSSRHYEGECEDDLIDNLEEYGKRKEVDVDLKEEDFFENGPVVGSSFFRFQFKEKNKATCP